MTLVATTRGTPQIYYGSEIGMRGDKGKGDGVKVQDTDGITLVNVKTEWTKGPHSENGAYGIYPVQCRNIVINNCIFSTSCGLFPFNSIFK